MLDLARRIGPLLGCKGHVDKGYDQPRNRAALREVGAEDRIAQTSIESGGLGRHRWGVERSFSHLAGFRRLERCYERDPRQHLASLQIACILKRARAILQGGC